jgi:hypothetical protein
MRRKPVLASEIVRYGILNVYMDKEVQGKYESATGRLVEVSTKEQIEQYVNEHFDTFYDLWHDRD